MAKKKCVAMLLAGGQGSRLLALTKNIAKPAVSFGGKYRIIDFSLSNCTNSGIDTVGVLTQYKPFALNAYIGIGSAWDLDNAVSGGARVLPPYVGETGGTWYKGTANAIYQNINFLNLYNPDYVLILSGDHIYKMNYDAMLEYHADKGADVTISVMDVPLEEASRFGIITTDADSRILRFTEKPKQPESTLASMGIYVFSWPVLKKALLDDEQDPASENDFGKNILPTLLQQGKNMFTYSFEGYWKDVGTIESLYEANMDLLSEHPQLDIYDASFPIFSNNDILPPQHIGGKASVKNCIIGNGCTIHGDVRNTIMHSGVTIGEGAKVEDCILLPNARIQEDCRLSKVIVGANTVISRDCVIGRSGIADPEQGGITVIEGFMEVPEGSVIAEGTNVYKN